MMGSGNIDDRKKRGGKKMAHRDLSKRTVAVLLILAIALSVVGTYLATKHVVVERSVSEGVVIAEVVPRESTHSVASAEITANVVAKR
ncbi:hypothetical protein GF351_00170 [Candidatus Woesearchaeota archaeon]|nr:hypothetical protein [Candidatus Woesearchaeota archaeon]